MTYGGKVTSPQRVGFCPRAYSADNGIDLYVGQHAASALAQMAGIGVPGTPFAMVCRMTASSAIARKTGSPNAIAAPAFTVRSVTSCTVLAIKDIGVDNFDRVELRLTPEQDVQANCCKPRTRAGRRSRMPNVWLCGSFTGSCLHRSHPLLPALRSQHGEQEENTASVRIRSCLETMMPATIPNPI